LAPDLLCQVVQSNLTTKSATTSIFIQNNYLRNFNLNIKLNNIEQLLTTMQKKAPLANTPEAAVPQLPIDELFDCPECKIIKLNMLFSALNSPDTVFISVSY
jgi:hypothetical protein